MRFIFALAVVSGSIGAAYAQTEEGSSKRPTTTPQATIERSEVPKKHENTPPKGAPTGQPVPPEQPYPPKTEKQEKEQKK